MLFPLLKWLHILSAIIAVGSNVTYGVWITRATRTPENLAFTLRGIKLIDDRIANPAYGLLLITGLSMVFTVSFSLTTPWLMTALILYALLVVIGLFGYSPTLRRQIQLIESYGLDSTEYRAMANRGTVLGILLAILAVSIIYLMVVKPPLWS
jgi:uncharacterized membrane protein